MTGVYLCLATASISQTVGLPDPKTLSMAASQPLKNLAGCCGTGDGQLDLYGCYQKRDILVCNFVFTRTAGRSATFKVDEGWHSTLVDNFRIGHPFLRGYFVNGRGQSVDSVLLGSGDWIWVTEEFAQGASDIVTARIVFDHLFGSHFDLTGPVSALH
jgi:hypothetical protein